MSPPTPLRIALIEDEENQRELVVELLRRQGHEVIAMDRAEALGPLSAAPPLVIIDIVLPGEDGLSLARRLRAARPEIGIVILTARRGTDDRVIGYRHGADAYLSKPIEAAELHAVVDALARRLPGAAPTLKLDTTRSCLVGAEATVALTPSETALIEALALAPRRQLELEQIAEVLGQDLANLNKSSLEVRVVRLRRKLADAGAGGDAIKAVRGRGYQLCTALTIE